MEAGSSPPGLDETAAAVVNLEGDTVNIIEDDEDSAESSDSEDSSDDDEVEDGDQVTADDPDYLPEVAGTAENLSESEDVVATSTLKATNATVRIRKVTCANLETGAGKGFHPVVFSLDNELSSIWYSMPMNDLIPPVS